MMKCFFRSFDVGPGDCNVIRLVKDSGEQYVIMVDCGNYTPSVKEYLHDTLNNHIDLLIATHIDGDHIQGTARMLQEHENLTIGEIWYNSYGRANQSEPVELNEQQKNIILQIQKSLPLEFDAINYREISATQGKTLAEVILSNDAYKSVWKLGNITTNTASYDIPGGWGRIVFLSPQQEALLEIEKKFKKAFNKYFMRVWNDSIEHGETLQELLVRLVDSFQNQSHVKSISSHQEPTYDANFIREQAKDEDADKSDTNYSSIAFMLECGEHKIAMLGDAYASTIIDAVDAKYPAVPKPIACDVIKVPHHGSNGNNSKMLYERIRSHRYYIPGGREENYPTWGTLGRIAESCHDGVLKTIVFSHPCSITRKMNELSAEVKQDLGIETAITEKEYELFEW